MAINATYDAAFNANYEMQSGLARGLMFASGTVKATYSAAGGLTMTLPFPHKTLYVAFSPIEFSAGSYVQMQYLYTSNMVQANEWLPTTTASGLCAAEVASDTDFTTTTLANHVRFVAFGF